MIVLLQPFIDVGVLFGFMVNDFDLNAAIGNAAPNVDYAAKKMTEHAEEVVEKSRADIDAMAAAAQGRQQLAIGAGLEAVEE